MPESRCRPTLLPVGRNATTIRTRPESSSQKPVSAAMTRSERSGQISTASPSAIAHRPVTRTVHQGKGCERSSLTVSGQGWASVSVMGQGWVMPADAGITPHG